MNSYCITDYGVKPDLEELQTDRIQRVIDLCRQSGGGRVIIPAGTYRVGSLRLYSDMTLYLEKGARLEGSEDYRDYEDFHVPTTLRYVTDPFYIRSWNLPPYYVYGILCAFGEERVAVIGEEGSVIDGRDCTDPDGEEGFRGPMGMIFSQCRDVTLEGYTFVNSANWSHQLDSCTQVSIRNVTVLAGHDGFNLHHCRHIAAEGCRLETGDDCFAGYDVENLMVRNCYMNTACNVMRLGGCDLQFRGCVMEGPGHFPHISEDTYDTHALFKYYSIGPDRIPRAADRILIQDCEISGMSVLLSYQFRKEGLHQDNQPLRSLVFDRVRISDIKKTSLYKGNGEEGSLTFKDSYISFQGSGDVPFLETDDSIRLVLENTEFESAAVIRTPSLSYTAEGILHTVL